MRYKTPAGVSGPLLIACAATVLAGCPTGVAQTDFANSPEVVAIYASDINGVLPDVALYVKGDTRVSKKAPSSYGVIKVEFDQPLKGESIANLESLNSNSACAPLASSPISLIDVTNANTVIPSSICYNPTTPLGRHPTVFITPGASTDPAKVFSCQAFKPYGGFDPDTTYSVKIDPSKIVGANGKTGAGLPTGSGWATGEFKFDTSHLEVLAAKFYDPHTGFTRFHTKPQTQAGYLKDLAAEDANTFRMSPTSDQFLIDLSEFVLSDFEGRMVAGAKVGDCDPDYADVAAEDAKCALISAGSVCNAFDDVLTGDTVGECHKADASKIVRKADGVLFPASVDAVSFDDGRVITVSPAETFEPDTEYTLTIDPTIQNIYRQQLEANQPLTYSFKADSASLRAIATSPVSNGTAVTFRAGAVQLNVFYQAPVAASTVTTENIKLKETASGTEVPITVSQPAGFNKQVIRVVPSAGAALKPATSYTLTVNNQVVDASPKELAGKALAPVTLKFTTATFRLDRIFDAGDTKATDLNRNQAVNAAVLRTGLNVRFNAAASGVDTTSLKLTDASATGGGDVPITITPGASTREFKIQAAETYKVKPNTKYVLKASTAINYQGTALTTEGCTGTGDQCADVMSFITAPMTPAIRLSRTTTTATNPLATKDGIFDVTFSYRADPATLNLPASASDTGKAIKLFKVASDGTLIQVGVTCTIGVPGTGGTSTTEVAGVKCQAAQTPDPNTRYQVVVTYLADAPLKVVAQRTLGGVVVNYDQTAGSFVGSRTFTFTSACP